MYSSSADCGAGAAGSAARGVRGEEGAGRGPGGWNRTGRGGWGLGGGVGAYLVALLHHLEPDLHVGAVSESVAAAAAAAPQVAAQQAVLQGAARQTMTLPGLRFWSPPTISAWRRWSFACAAGTVMRAGRAIRPPA
jgi:hypothetical protein